MLQDLYTKQGEALRDTPWHVYPRPQMKRENWLNLNGKWQFAVGKPDFDGKTILVPFCPESALSGVKQHYPEGTTLWYRRSFTLPEGFHGEESCCTSVRRTRSPRSASTAITFTAMKAAMKPSAWILPMCCRKKMRSSLSARTTCTISPSPTANRFSPRSAAVCGILKRQEYGRQSGLNLYLKNI